MRSRLALLAALVVLPACGGQPPDQRADLAPRGVEPPYRILVYTRTAGFRHASIEPAVATLRTLGRRHGFTVSRSEDPAHFTHRNLAPYAALVFLSTTGDVLPAPRQRAALRRYVRDGGGWFGIHAASDMGELATTWPWYRRLVGASFEAHPLGTARATLRVETPRVWNVRGLGRRWRRTDEWYAWRQPAREIRRRVRVLVTIDESSYAPARGWDAAMGPVDPETRVGRPTTDHPMIWCHRYDGGRSVYTAGGHTPESFTADSRFVRHVLRSIEMAAGRAPFHCRPGRRRR